MSDTSSLIRRYHQLQQERLALLWTMPQPEIDSELATIKEKLIEAGAVMEWWNGLSVDEQFELMVNLML